MYIVVSSRSSNLSFFSRSDETIVQIASLLSLITASSGCLRDPRAKQERIRVMQIGGSSIFLRSFEKFIQLVQCVRTALTNPLGTRH